MARYVVRTKHGSNYLCDIPGYSCPQWWERKTARAFDSAAEARAWAKVEAGREPWVVVRLLSRDEVVARARAAGFADAVEVVRTLLPFDIATHANRVVRSGYHVSPTIAEAAQNAIVYALETEADDAAKEAGR